MQRDNLYEPFQIVLKEVLDRCPRPMHSHTFFELVYIVQGTGLQYINDTSIRYRPGHLFLLTPADAHCFEIDEPTQFLFIRFNDLHIRSRKLDPDEKLRLGFILKNANHEPGCILQHAADRTVVKSILEAVINEQHNRHLYHGELVQHFVSTLIMIVARNIASSLPEKVDETTEEKTLDILQYIQANIHQPEHIRAEHISQHFGISETYLGRYFKKHVNETMQQYIINYKLKLVEHRLLHSNMRMNEIADEFGFTDKSHLNRIFKKHKGINPGEFKKQQRALLAID
jgi:AraC-like DNA-binding protein